LFERQQFGLSCRWLYGAVRQQCAGHLPFERQATPNGGFSILPTGATDPILSLSFFENCRSRGRVTSLVPPVVEGWFIVGLHFTWNLAS
jgi:hypothetical protein